MSFGHVRIDKFMSTKLKGLKSTSKTIDTVMPNKYWFLSLDVALCWKVFWKVRRRPKSYARI